MTKLTKETAFNSMCNKNIEPNMFTIIIAIVPQTINAVYRSKPINSEVTTNIAINDTPKFK